ncbi:MAG TPA: rod shape-determining protein MreC [Vicinamibacteria bacterium]
MAELRVPQAVSTRKSRLLLAILVLGHLVVISRQVESSGSGVSLLERTLLSAFRPVHALLSGAVRGVEGVWRSYVDLRGVRAENRRLRQEVAVLRGSLMHHERLAHEAGRLRELASLQKVLPVPTAMAVVIAREGVPWFRTLVIDKGLDDGLRLSAPVLSANGVVGRIIGLGPRAAKVQLLLDAESGVAVRVERSRVTGVVEGQAGTAGDLAFKYVPLLADVVEGDVVVTSGLDRIYPPGLVVGRVRTVKRGAGLFKEIQVAPSARFDTIEEVLVVTAPVPDATITQTVQ